MKTSLIVPVGMGRGSDAVKQRCQTCGGQRTLRIGTDGNGRLREMLEVPCACGFPAPARRQETEAERARRHAGLCRHCDSPVAGGIRAAYCAEHRRAARLQVERQNRERNGDSAQRKYRENNRELLAEKSRARYQDSQAERDRRNDYKRRWRALNPEKVRRQKERYALRTYATSGEAAKRWREEVAAGLRTPKPARRNLRGERLCIAPDCPSVVRGMAKMCRACKRARKDAALEALRAA